MAWVAISISEVMGRLTGAESSVLQTTTVGPGQTDPLPGIIVQVVDEVRGYVAGNPINRLGDPGTLPAKLKSAAIALIRYRLIGKLPVKALLTEERNKENEQAIKLLEQVAEAKINIDDPWTGLKSVGAVEQVSTPVRLATRNRLRGL